MKKVLLILLSLLLVVTVTACDSTKNLEANVEKVISVPDGYQDVFEILTNNIMEESKTGTARMYIFNPDGQYINYYATKIMFQTSDNIFIARGTWAIDEDGRLVLHNKEVAYLVPDDNGNFNIDIRTQEYDMNYSNVKKYDYAENEVVANGIHFYPKPSLEGTSLLTEVKRIMNEGFDDLDVEKLKTLDEEYLNSVKQ